MYTSGEPLSWMAECGSLTDHRFTPLGGWYQGAWSHREEAESGSRSFPGLMAATQQKGTSCPRLHLCTCGQLPTSCLLAVKDHFYCWSFHHYEPNLDFNLFIIHNSSINNSNNICLAWRILAFSFSFLIRTLPDQYYYYHHFAEWKTWGFEKKLVPILYKPKLTHSEVWSIVITVQLSSEAFSNLSSSC